MKTTQVKKPGAEKLVSKQTLVLPSLEVTNTVRLFHQQAVRQSTHYQSGEVIYGAEMHVANNPKAISAGLKALEDLVENSLGDKLPQMNALLKGLATHNA